MLRIVLGYTGESREETPQIIYLGHDADAAQSAIEEAADYGRIETGPLPQLHRARKRLPEASGILLREKPKSEIEILRAELATAREEATAAFNTALEENAALKEALAQKAKLEGKLEEAGKSSAAIISAPEIQPENPEAAAPELPVSEPAAELSLPAGPPQAFDDSPEPQNEGPADQPKGKRK